MATYDLSTYHTLVEVRNRLDPDGSLADIINVLVETNEMVQDIMWMEANDKTSHLSTVTSALPTARIRRINQGVSVSKASVSQIRDVIQLTEAWSEIDERLVKMSGNPGRYRYDEDMHFVESFAQAVPGYFIYGEGADEEISGFATRYDALSDANVNSLGGSGSDLTSIWIVQWGRQVHGLYPPGSQGGLAMEDKGIQTKGSSTLYDVYRTKFTWDFGLAVADSSSATRHPIQRLCNVDTSSIATLAASSLPDIDDALIYALRHMPNNGTGAIIYGNADALTIFDRLAKDKSNVWWGTGTDLFGRQVTTFQGHPIHMCDQILSTETAIS